MRMLAGVAALLVIGVLAVSAHAQLPTRENYLHFIPHAPRIMGQAAASERLQLFGDLGDPAYDDIGPRDGIDDRRGRRLLALGEHFSPILRRNTYHVPRLFEDVLGGRVILYADTWREGELVASAAIDLGPPLDEARFVLEPALGDGGGPDRTRVAPDDAELATLLRSFHPRRTVSNVVPPEGTLETVLYFDVPGENETTWRRLHGRRLPERTRIYLHPFIHDAQEPAGDATYELVLQYWFYYPYNDGGNNHEGDWEHVNVVVTTEARAAGGEDDPAKRGLLTDFDIARILSSDDPLPLDSLRIWYVSYYFHNLVMRVDYLDIAAGGTLWSRRESGDGAIHVWEDTRYMDDAIRRRLELAGGRLATHPIGYIAGDNKGTDELLHLWPRFSRSFNRDSHGTYPFPGVWRKIGPLDATEKVSGDVVPRVRADPTLPWHELIDDDRYLTYRADDIILLPDWERLAEMVLEDPEVRREWAWFVLPVHMGFPAVGSPGAGALRRVDLGNIAPMSPAYNNAWNRPGATEVYRPYHPTVLSVMFAPISPLTSLKSGWGALNLPIVVWALLPGGNVAVTQLLPFATGALQVLGAPPGRTLYQGDLPDRFTGSGLGVYRQFGGTDFARLLPGREHPAVEAYLGENGAGGARIGGHRWSPGWGSRLWLNLYYNRKLSVENTFGYAEADITYAVVDSLERNLSQVSGRLITRELTGGITYRLPALRLGLLDPYMKAGYGWTAYSVGAVSLGATGLEEGDRRGGYMLHPFTLRSWWPNTLYGGLGVEYLTRPERWLLRRVGYGLRLEATGLLHRLRTDGVCDCQVTAEKADVALVFHLGW